uniref:DUF937 domain-containing protein n=1 Tax=uncultured microorganism TaxID=358574 RepID=L8B164_9ZZZZ|nr:conserved hypothetical protein [uncultured microorganism]
MSLMKLLEQAGGGQGLAQLASQFGLDESKASELSGLLAPAIGSAAKQQAQGGGLGDLLGALKGEGQGALFDDPAQAASPEGQAQGMAFLENMLGGSEGAQGLAAQAAEKTGVDMNTIMQFMPAIAGMLQGGMQKQMPDTEVDGLMSSLGGGGGLGGMISGLMGGKSGSGPDLSMLTNMLDADGDGSIVDDIMGKFMK